MNNLQGRLRQLGEQAHQMLAVSWESDEVLPNLETFARQAKTLGEQLVEIGDLSKTIKETIESNDIKQRFLLEWMHFEWPHRAKGLMILWRDVLFELQRGRVLMLDEKTNLQEISKIVEQSKETLGDAIDEVFTTIETGKYTTPRKEKMLAAWGLQQNPWPVYSKQIIQLGEQCKYLQTQYRDVINLTGEFESIRQLITRTEQFCWQDVAKIKQIAEETIQQKGTEQTERLSKLALQIEDLEAGIDLPNYFNIFTDTLGKEVNRLPEQTEVAVATQGGQVIMKELFPRRNTKQWLNSEILPLLYEIWELTENAHNGLKMALINIKNRAILLSNEENKDNQVDESIFQPLQTFKQRLSETLSGIQQYRHTLEARMSADFRASNIYAAEREFLPIPLQATLRQFRRNQDRLQNNVANWFVERWRWLQNIRESVKKEEALSDSEKIVRLITSRNKIQQANTSYSSIFLTKGFIGKSFAVGRHTELTHAQEMINNWRAGYRGSLCITGQRFAGKTMLGELIANQFFEQNTIRLQPNSLIKLNGRRMTTSHDLGEALSFIQKYARYGSPPMVWIDDLELWRDRNLPLGKNVRILRKYIDNHASLLFFMVSMSNWLQVYLQRFYNLNQSFQTVINVDNMTTPEVTEAIMLRHGATHKTLVNEEGTELSAVQIEKKIRSIYRLVEGNIGEALNMWSQSIHSLSENEVTYQAQENFVLPDFLNSLNTPLLTSIMLEKRTNEYSLRKLYGPAFSERYAPVLQRLINTGVLERQLDNRLEINDLLVNNIGKLLERKGHLDFYHYGVER